MNKLKLIKKPNGSTECADSGLIWECPEKLQEEVVVTVKIGGRSYPVIRPHSEPKKRGF